MHEWVKERGGTLVHDVVCIEFVVRSEQMIQISKMGKNVFDLKSKATV